MRRAGDRRVGLRRPRRAHGGRRRASSLVGAGSRSGRRYGETPRRSREPGDRRGDRLRCSACRRRTTTTSCAPCVRRSSCTRACASSPRARTGAPAIQIQSGLHAGSVVAQRLNEGPRRYAIVGAPATVASRLAAAGGPGRRASSARNASVSCRRSSIPSRARPWCSKPDAPAVTPFRVTGRNRSRDAARGVGAIGPDAVCRPAVRPGAARRLRRACRVGRGPRGRDRRRSRRRKEPPAARASPAASRPRAVSRCCRADAARLATWRHTVRSSRSCAEPLRIERRRPADSADLVATSARSMPSLEPFVAAVSASPLGAERRAPAPASPAGRASAGRARGCARRRCFAVLSQAAHARRVVSRTGTGPTARRGPCSSACAEIVADGAAALHRDDAAGTSASERVASARWPTFALEPLDFAASAAIIEAGLGAGHVSERLAQRVFERTGGNPFFLEQVCRALVEQGAVSVRDGEAVVEGGPADAVAAGHGAGGHSLAPRQPGSRTRERSSGSRRSFGREFEHALLADVLGPDVDLAPGDRPALGSRPDLRVQRASLDSAIASRTC